MEMVGGEAEEVRHIASAGRHRLELDMWGAKSGCRGGGGPRHTPGSALMIATPGPHI